eukprot:12267380-Alexandrium_andersonii.AAC.1
MEHLVSAFRIPAGKAAQIQKVHLAHVVKTLVRKNYSEEHLWPDCWNTVMSAVGLRLHLRCVRACLRVR